MLEENKKRMVEFTEKIINILETGVATLAVVLGVVAVFAKIGYANDCSLFYGIHKRYFDGSDMFLEKGTLLVISALLVVYPLIFGYLSKKMNEAYNRWIFAVISMMILLVQNMVFTQNIINSTQCRFIQMVAYSKITIIAFIASDAMIVFNIFFRKYHKKGGRAEKAMNIVLMVALLIYVSNAVWGIMALMNREIKDERAYETISEENVIVSTYEGMFVVMKCKIEEDVLYIEKGGYSLVEMRDVEISYKEFENVVCE